METPEQAEMPSACIETDRLCEGCGAEKPTVRTDAMRQWLCRDCLAEALALFDPKQNPEFCTCGGPMIPLRGNAKICDACLRRMGITPPVETYMHADFKGHTESPGVPFFKCGCCGFELAGYPSFEVKFPPEWHYVDIECPKCRTRYKFEKGLETPTAPREDDGTRMGKTLCGPWAPDDFLRTEPETHTTDCQTTRNTTINFDLAKNPPRCIHCGEPIRIGGVRAGHSPWCPHGPYTPPAGFLKRDVERGDIEL